MADLIPVKVGIRARPFIRKEFDEGNQICLNVNPIAGTISAEGDGRIFTFDHTYSPEATQDEVYDSCVAGMVPQLFKGFNVTVLAYGQTGSGKTYTMGTETTVHQIGDPSVEGIIPRVVTDIFGTIEQMTTTHSVTVKLSFLEVYNDDLLDLLAGKKMLMLRQVDKKIHIPGKTEHPVTGLKEVLGCLERGSEARTKGSTAMNESSSRSHAVFTLELTITNRIDDSDVVSAKCQMVDLAGSERLERTRATGARAQEGININLGLFALGKVIEALSTNQSFVPYRDHMLTQLLRDSLGGNSHTMFLACVSPADSNWDETRSTLRYAEKASRIKNKPIVNRDPVTAELCDLRKQNAALRQRVHELEAAHGLPSSLKLNKMLGSTNKINDIGKFNDQTDTIKSLQSKTDEISAENKKLTIQLAELGKKFVATTLALNEKEDQYNQMADALAGFQESLAALDDPKLDQSLATLREITRGLNGFDQTNDPLGCGGGAGSDGDDDDNTTMMRTIGAGAFDTTQSAVDYESKAGVRQTQLATELNDIMTAITANEEKMKLAVMNDAQLEALRAQYEADRQALQSKTDSIEKERDELMQQLRSVKSSGKLGEQRRKRLQELEMELKETQKRLKDVLKFEKMKQNADKEIVRLKNEISDMKHAKVRLYRQIKTEAEKFRKFKQEKDREVNSLKQKNRRQEFEAKKAKQDSVKQQAVMKQKYEQAAALIKRLQAKEGQRKQTWEESSSMELTDRMKLQIKNLMKDEISRAADAQEAREHKDMLIQQRSELTRRKRQLEQELDKPPKKLRNLGEGRSSSTDEDTESAEQEIAQLTEEIRLRSDQISTFQSQIAKYDDAPSDARWNRLRNVPQARYALAQIFEMACQANVQIDQLKSVAGEARSAAAVSEAELMRTQQAVQDVRTELESQLKEQYNKYQSDGAYLLRQIELLRRNQSVDDSGKIDNLQMKYLEKLEDMAEDLEKSRVEHAETVKELELAKSRGGARSKSFFKPFQNGEMVSTSAKTGAPTPMSRVGGRRSGYVEGVPAVTEEGAEDNAGAEKRGMRRSRSGRIIKPSNHYAPMCAPLSKVDEAGDEAGGNPASDGEDDSTWSSSGVVANVTDEEDSQLDPTYHEKTPVEPKIRGRRTYAVAEVEDGGAVAVKAAAPAKPCKCTTDCSTRRCRCQRRNGNSLCGSGCSCAVGVCANRTRQTRVLSGGTDSSSTGEEEMLVTVVDENTDGNRIRNSACGVRHTTEVGGTRKRNSKRLEDKVNSTFTAVENPAVNPISSASNDQPSPYDFDSGLVPPTPEIDRRVTFALQRGSSQLASGDSEGVGSFPRSSPVAASFFKNNHGPLSPVPTNERMSQAMGLGVRPGGHAAPLSTSKLFKPPVCSTPILAPKK